MSPEEVGRRRRLRLRGGRVSQRDAGHVRAVTDGVGDSGAGAVVNERRLTSAQVCMRRGRRVVGVGVYAAVDDRNRDAGAVHAHLCEPRLVAGNRRSGGRRRSVEILGHDLRFALAVRLHARDRLHPANVRHASQRLDSGALHPEDRVLAAVDGRLACLVEDAAFRGLDRRTHGAGLAARIDANRHVLDVGSRV